MSKIFTITGDYIIYGIAHLPLKVLYVFSDIVFFILFYVVRYRRKVAEKNISESFPDAGAEEVKSISRKFYRNFADYIFETLKLAHISDEEMAERMQFENVEAMDKAIEEGKSVVIYFSHCFNWEWATSVILHSKFRNDDKVIFGQVYRPLNSKWFDDLMLRLRGRFGAHCFKKKSVLRDLLTINRDKKVWIVGFMSDQKPSHGDGKHVLMFLNHPTAVISGTEILANRLKTAAIFWKMSKVSRGHYNIEMCKLADDASQCEANTLTDKYFSILEQNIISQPDIWLWTHKRWKIPVTLNDDNETNSSNNP